MHGGQQVGFSEFFGVLHASLWSGTAASRISLHPAGATESIAFDVYNGRQVGYAVTLGQRKASIWAGNIGSWLSLHPAGASLSQAFGIYGDFQSGWAEFGGNNRASLWSGTAKSWIDLHLYVPAGFAASVAADVWQDSSRIYVVGFANNTPDDRKAMMWVSRIVSPVSFTPVRGIVTGGNQQSLESSDDNRLTLRPGIVFSTQQAPVEVRFDATAPSANPNGLSFSIESSASFGNAQQTIMLWNYVTSSYESLDARLLTTGDDVAYVTVRTNPERFIQPGTLAVRGAVSVRAAGPAFAYPWTARIDKVWWNFPG
jgi:hypothetical protein